MINAGIVGLGWWGRNLVEAVQNRSDRLRFVRGACRDTAPVPGAILLPNRRLAA
jgi:hypothetical protein